MTKLVSSTPINLFFFFFFFLRSQAKIMCNPLRIFTFNQIMRIFKAQRMRDEYDASTFRFEDARDPLGSTIRPLDLGSS